MKKFIWVLVLLGSLMIFSCSRKPKTSCVYGDNIQADVLEPALEVGESVIFALEAQDFDRLYNWGGEFLRRGQTREQFRLILQAVFNSIGTIEFSQLQEAYYLTNQAPKKMQTVNVPCNLEMENVNDIYQVPANREIVSLIYSGMGGEESMHILVELIKEGEEWRLFSLVPGLASFQGKNAEDYITRARKAREENKLKLALLYYKLAFLLSDYSPNILEFVSVKIGQEMSQIRTDYMPMGNPQVWTVSGDLSFEVYNVDVLIEKNEPWVNVDYIVDSFSDTEKLEKNSEKLLDFAMEKLSETREFFKGIAVSGHSKDPKLVGQVHRKFREFPKSNP